MSGLNLLGQQFVHIGDDAALGLQEIISSADLAGHDIDGNAQSELWVFSNGGYEFFKYVSEQDAADWEMPEISKKWVDANYAAAVGSVDAANGIWVKTTTTSQIFFAGQVYSETNVVVSIDAGLNLIANPFPVTWDVQNFATDDLAGHDIDGNAQSELWVFSNGGYTFYKYVSIQDAADWEMPEISGKWVDANYVPATEIVAPGYGFWVTTTSNASITFTRGN